MHEFQDRERLDQLMFDKSFELSKKYFSVLKFLELASKSSEDPKSNFEAMRGRFDAVMTRSTRYPDLEGYDTTKGNWERVTQSISEVTGKLQNRVDQQTKRIRSHQESVSWHFGLSHSRSCLTRTGF